MMKIDFAALNILPDHPTSRNVARVNLIFGDVVVIRDCLIAARKDGRAFLMFPRNNKGDRTSVSILSAGLMNRINEMANAVVARHVPKELWQEACRRAFAHHELAITERNLRIEMAAE
jgi:hypothetical protein